MKKILFGLLAITLLSGCEFNLENNIKDNEKDPVEENKITELSKESNEVKNIVDTFIEPISSISDGENQYTESKIFSNFIVMKAAENQKLFKKDNSCDESKYENLAAVYECKYISYTDLNNLYVNLFGNTLPKQTLECDSHRGLVYNSKLDTYELIGYMTGGNGFGKLSKLIKAEQDNEKIYIYENVVYLGDNLIYFPHNKLELKISSDKSYEEFKQELLTKYLSKFDTYKWTFKKNDNGTYMYESIEYVEQ